MSSKIASGAWHDGGPALAPARPGQEAELERLRGNRDNARWSAVVGFGLMFGAGFHVGFAVGGAAMVLYGAAASVYWSRRLLRLKGDPWDYDPELDGPAAPRWSRDGTPPRHEGPDLEDDLGPR